MFPERVPGGRALGPGRTYVSRTGSCSGKRDACVLTWTSCGGRRRDTSDFRKCVRVCVFLIRCCSLRATNCVLVRELAFDLSVAITSIFVFTFLVCHGWRGSDYTAVFAPFLSWVFVAPVVWLGGLLQAQTLLHGQLEANQAPMRERLQGTIENFLVCVSCVA